MGWLTTLYFIEFEFSKNGTKYAGRGNFEKGVLVSWDDIHDAIKEKVGADRLFITKVRKLD